MTSFYNISQDNTLGGNNASHNAVSSQRAIKEYVENKTVGVAYGESTTAAATAQKEVTVPDISELNVGQIIIVKPTITSTVANSTLKVNDFPAYSMLYNGNAISTSTDSIVWAANVPSWFVLDDVSGTRYWRFAGHGLDSNSTYTLNKLIDAGQYTAGTGTYAVTRYSILAEKPDGTWEKITSTASKYSTGTTKTVNTSGFVLNQLRYYNTTTNIATGTLITTNTLEKQSASINYAYSLNCGTEPGWNIGDYIYLVETLGSDGLFYLDTTQWWSTSLPSTEDGKLYIHVGIALTTTDATGSFLMERPIYYYKGGAVRLWSNVSGVNDGTNWTSLTIDGVTKNLPSGGGGNSFYVVDHIIYDDTVDTHPFYTYSNGATAYSLDDEQIYEFDNGSWVLDSSKVISDGMVIFCNEDNAWYKYEVQHKLKSLSRGVPYRTLSESDPDFEERICLPTCDSVCTILITNNSRATTNYNIVVLGQKGEEYHQQQTGHVHTINIINDSSNNMTYTIVADGYISYNNLYQHMYNGVDNNNSFVVKAGDAAEISIQLVPYDNGTYYGSIPNVIVKTDIEWTIQSE